MKGHLAVVELLLKHKKIDVKQAANDGSTPLYIASQKGQSAVVELLLKHEKIDVNQAENQGATPFFIASVYGHSAVVKLLLSNEADSTLRTAKGNTPLLIAEDQNHTEIVEIFKSNEARISDIVRPPQMFCTNSTNPQIPRIHYWRQLNQRKKSKIRKNEALPRRSLQDDEEEELVTSVLYEHAQQLRCSRRKKVRYYTREQ